MKREEVAIAMREANGDFTLAAAALDRTPAAVRGFVARDPQLAALWLPNSDDVSTPDEIDLMSRNSLPAGIPKVEAATDTALGEAMLRMDRETLRQGLMSAGIKEDTVRSLGLMENFAENTGRFLGASLDLTHKMTLFQGVAMFERAEHIRKTYLENETLPHEVRIGWQSAYNELAELIGKTSDRMLVATQAAVAMLKKKEEQEGGGKKGKPGFSPLTKTAEASE